MIVCQLAGGLAKNEVFSVCGIRSMYSRVLNRQMPLLAIRLGPPQFLPSGFAELSPWK